jgi:hypothetical protein
LSRALPPQVEAAKGNQNAVKGKTVVPQSEARLFFPQKTQPNRLTKAKADMLEVSRPAAERAATIKKKSPELAEKVAAGEMSACAVRHGQGHIGKVSELIRPLWLSPQDLSINKGL